MKLYKPNHLLSNLILHVTNKMMPQLLPKIRLFLLSLLSLLSLLPSFMAEANITNTNRIIDLDRIVA
ncbi:MAG: hypothetical protein KAS48_04010, partial [Gammaproteobacteria bacterium]|nr:hypothetical protein [Gammaproteobacteria bacterium]